MKNLFLLVLTVYDLSRWSSKAGHVNAPVFVAFSVGRTKHQTEAGRVTYDKVMLNIGNGYSTGNDAFIAPVAGIYQITFSGLNYVEGEAKKHLYMSLYKNTEYLVSTYESGNSYGSGSNTVLAQLRAGDEIYMKLSGSNTGLFNKDNQVYATFSGHLIVPIYEVTTYIGGVTSTEPLSCD